MRNWDQRSRNRPLDAGVEFIMAEATAVTQRDDRLVVASDAGEHRAKSVVVAAGSNLRQLGIPERRSCRTRRFPLRHLRRPLYMGQVVGVVGGGDSAADEALTLSEYAERVILFLRGDKFRAQKVLQDRLGANPKIEVVWNTVVERVVGEDTVSAVAVRHALTDSEGQVELSGLFVYVGLEPGSNLVSDLVGLDNAGHIPVDISMKTEIAGLYAVGDIRQHSSSQLISAAGDGAPPPLLPTTTSGPWGENRRLRVPLVPRLSRAAAGIFQIWQMEGLWTWLKNSWSTARL